MVGDDVLPGLGNEIICGVEARLEYKYQNFVVHFSVTDFGRKFYCKNYYGVRNFMQDVLSLEF